MASSYIAHQEDWPHQSYAVQEAIRLENEGAKTYCITSATGGGKSRIMQRLCEHKVHNGERVGIVSHRKLLTTQLLCGLNQAGIRVGCRAAEFEAWTDGDAPVQIMSAQTELARVINNRGGGENHELCRVDSLIIDEAHGQSGDETKAMFAEYRQKHDATLIGITATPVAISDIYQNLIVAGNNSQLRACGALVMAKVAEPAVFDLDKVKKKKTGEVVTLETQASMERQAKAVWSQAVVGHIFANWKKFNPDGRPSLGMAPGVAESKGMSLEYWRRGVPCAHIDGEGIMINGKYKKTSHQADRDEMFAMSKDGRILQIWNRYVLREAIDLPFLYVLTLATPIASLTSYLQVVGRVLRASSGKDHAWVIDHAGSVRMHGSPNMDRDKEWEKYFYDLDPDKITKDRLRKLADPHNKEPEPITCPECGTIRSKGSKCHHCSYESTGSVRKIIQESGELREATGDVYPTRKCQMRSNTERLWKETFFQMKNCRKPKTFSQAVAWFIRQHYYRPPENLKFMPKNASDWCRHINDVHLADLH